MRAALSRTETDLAGTQTSETAVVQADKQGIVLPQIHGLGGDGIPAGGEDMDFLPQDHRSVPIGLPDRGIRRILGKVHEPVENTGCQPGAQFSHPQ